MWEFSFGEVVSAFKRLVVETAFDPDAKLRALADEFFFEAVVAQVEALERNGLLRSAEAPANGPTSPALSRALRVVTAGSSDPDAAKPLGAAECAAWFRAERSRRNAVEQMRVRSTVERREALGREIERFYASAAEEGRGCSVAALVEALVTIAPAEEKDRSALDDLRDACARQPAVRHPGCAALLLKLAATRGHAAVRERRATLLRQVCGAVQPDGPCARELPAEGRLTAAEVATQTSLCRRLGMKKQTLHDDLTLLTALR